MNKTALWGCLMMICGFVFQAEAKDVPRYRNAGLPVEERVADLLNRMTLEEKILQLNQYTLGNNNNVNNLGEVVGKIPAETGSLIYFDQLPELRNAMQKRAVEETRLGITMHERITEVEEVYEKGVFTFTPTFGSPLPEKLDLGDDTE